MTRIKSILLSLLALMTGPQAVAGPIGSDVSNSGRVTQSVNSDSRFPAEATTTPGQHHAVPVHGEVALFVGSSSIRLWDVAQSFPALHPINRGFGGATVGDVLFRYDQIIAGVKPKSVIVYVGENDVALGEPDDQVAAAVLKLLGRLRTDYPEARIAYLSMKPTPQRWELYPRMAEINAAVRARAGQEFDYLDVGAALLSPSGQPDADYFADDGLHMNARGYSVWNGIVGRWLDPDAPQQKVADRGSAAS
jgi:lysophospholipase L1-like esterase